MVFKVTKPSQIALLLPLLLCPGISYSTTVTSTFSVTATVLSTCITTAAPFSFGNYDPITGSNWAGTSNISITCTSSTPYNIGLDAGTGSGATVNVRKMTRVGGSDLINYSLYQDNAHTQVWGNTVGTNTVASTGTGIASSFTVYGSVPSGQAIPPGSYLDTITLTITY